jgi:hypothetical protein
VAVDGDCAGAAIDDAADDADQLDFAGPVGPEQGEDLAAADVQVDALEGLEAGGVGLGDVADGDDGGISLWHRTVDQSQRISSGLRALICSS